MNFSGFEKVADIFICNILFVLCSIPIVTIGASATAMHYALYRVRKGEGKVVSDFFRSFRSNFSQATGIWLILLLLLSGVLLNFWMVSAWLGWLALACRIGLVIVGVFVCFTANLAFVMLARFDNTTLQTLKNSLVVSAVYPVRSLCAAAITLAPVALAILLPNLFEVTAVLWTVMLCASGAYIIQLLFGRVLDRMAPQESADSQREHCEN